MRIYVYIIRTTVGRQKRTLNMFPFSLFLSFDPAGPHVNAVHNNWLEQYDYYRRREQTRQSIFSQRIERFRVKTNSIMR